MKNILRTAICTFLMIALIIPLTAVNAFAAKPKISRSSVNVPIDYSVTVKVTGASNVTWSSDNESVATVKADGASAKITGKKTGSATISAKVGSTTLKCAVTVKKSFITPSTENVTVSNGKTKTITLKVSGSKDIAIINNNKDVCSTSWGKWDGNTIKLTITGKSEGNAKIKIFTKKYSESTTEEITVTVGKKSEDNTRIDEVVELVNKERKAAGKDALQADDELNAIAAVRAKEIAEEFDHKRPDGTSCFTALDEEGYSYTIAAENIALTYNNSTDEVVNIWMHSSGHKANILNGDVTKIGVGYYEINGKHYWVQVFAG